MSMANDIKEFDLNGGTVKVFIPKQAVDIDVIVQPLENIDTMDPDPIGFHPFRLVINLKVVEKANHNNEIRTFNPPIEIHVQFTQADFDTADATRRELRLGYWDGTRWSRFTESKHKFQRIPDRPTSGGGWGVVQITKWDDPTKAWGT